VSSALESAPAGAAREILGPTPPLIERLRGRHRLQLLVKGDLDDEGRRGMVRAAREALAGMKGIDLQWDVDPVTLS